MQPARKQDKEIHVQKTGPELDGFEAQNLSHAGYQIVPSIVAQAGLPEVVVAHSDPGVRSLLAAVLRKDGYRAFTVTDGIELLEWLADRLLDDDCPGMPDIVVAEIGLPGRRGVDILADLRYSGLSPPFIFTARPKDQDLIDNANRLGLASVFLAPFEIDDFRTSVFCYSSPDRSRPQRFAQS